MSPAAVVAVQPINTATFYAVRWQDNDDGRSAAAIHWMADEFGWKVHGVMSVAIRGRMRRALLIVGRNRKQYRALHGDWIIALGANGSIRICSDKQYKIDYKEIAK